MKKTNRFLMLIIILFSIVAFTPSPYVNLEDQSDQVIIHDDDHYTFVISEVHSSLFRYGKENVEGKKVNLLLEKNIRALRLYDTNECYLQNQFNRNGQILLLDIEDLCPGNYSLDLVFESKAEIVKTFLEIKA